LITFDMVLLLYENFRKLAGARKGSRTCLVSQKNGF
jgi:hypothetical protein